MLNAKQAKERIRIVDLLNQAGYQPVKISGDEYLYKSPLRNETRASLQVDVRRNIFNDFGSSSEFGRGDLIDFARYLYGLTSVREALQKLSGLSGEGVAVLPPKQQAARSEAGDTLRMEITKVVPLTSKGLLRYLQAERGIDPQVAKAHLKQVHYRIAGGKEIFAAGFENDRGGWELRNAFDKRSSSPKDIRIIPGSADTVQCFEGFMDYMSAVQLNRGQALDDTAVIINGVSLQERAIEAIRKLNPKRVELFRDNDAAGLALKDRFNEALPGIEVIDKAPEYDGFKDLNAWHGQGVGIVTKHLNDVLKRQELPIDVRQERRQGPSM